MSDEKIRVQEYGACSYWPSSIHAARWMVPSLTLPSTTPAALRRKPMTPSERLRLRVLIAEEEAKRFLERVQAYKKADKDGNKESAAMKRASMDLTRALVDVRRSPYKE